MSINALTIAQFRVLLPVFADAAVYSDLFLANALDEAWRQMNPDRLGVRTSDAQKYLVAHLITLFPPTGAAGTAAREVASVTAGRATVSYVNSQGASPISGSLESTIYGKEYMRIVALTGGATLVNGMGLL